MRVREATKFWWFLAATITALAANVALGLDWFYAGFVFGVVVGGLLFQRTGR